MAITYLNQGATSLAAGNWSDATGFADNATLIINRPFGPITGGASGLDQSAVTDGATYLEIVGSAEGQLGDASNPLRADFNDGSSPHLLYAPKGGVLYYYPGGNETTCTEFEASGNGTYHILGGGTVTTLRHSTGIGDVASTVIVTNAEFWGSAQATIEYNATGFTDYKQHGGNVIAKRVGTTMDIMGGNLVLDASAGAITTINLRGGNLTLLRSGTITTFNHFGGRVNLRDVQIAITITNCNVYPNADPAAWSNRPSLLTVTPSFKGRSVGGNFPLIAG